MIDASEEAVVRECSDRIRHADVSDYGHYGEFHSTKGSLAWIQLDVESSWDGLPISVPRITQSTMITCKKYNRREREKLFLCLCA